MSYKFIEEKINNNKLVILDGAMGSELEKIGAVMDKNLWWGTCSVEFPELVKKVHEDYIEAGADVIIKSMEHLRNETLNIFINQ